MAASWRCLDRVGRYLAIHPSLNLDWSAVVYQFRASHAGLGKSAAFLRGGTPNSVQSFTPNNLQSDTTRDRVFPSTVRHSARAKALRLFRRKPVPEPNP